MQQNVFNRMVASLLLVATIVVSLPLNMVTTLANAVTPVPSHVYTASFAYR